MLKADQDVFLSFPSQSGSRVLFGVRIVHLHDELLAVRFHDPESIPTSAQDADGPSACTLFFQGPREFMQQPCEIGPAPEGFECEGEFDFVLALMGDAVSAESRKCFRVSTVLADYKGAFGAMGVCPIVDVSATGLAFITDKRLKVGDTIDLQFELNGDTYKGRGAIQSIAEVADGFRYGLLCSDATADMGKGLQKLTMDAQRTQLRRLSGAA